MLHVPLAGSLESLAAECLPHEIVARFLLSSSHFRASDRRVKPIAFDPSPIDGTTSVFRTLGLKEADIWALGDDHVARPQHRNIHGRADLTVGFIQSLTLNVMATPPPPRHASIGDWPPEKHSRLSIAQQLAAEATLSTP